MTNEEWQRLLDGLHKIMADPYETKQRRDKAFWTWHNLTGGSTGTTMHQAEGKQKSSRLGAVLTEAQYDGWMNNRD